jgi:hypothetical protein
MSDLSRLIAELFLLSYTLDESTTANTSPPSPSHPHHIDSLISLSLIDRLRGEEWKREIDQLEAKQMIRLKGENSLIFTDGRQSESQKHVRSLAREYIEAAKRSGEIGGLIHNLFRVVEEEGKVNQAELSACVERVWCVLRNMVVLSLNLSSADMLYPLSTYCRLLARKHSIHSNSEEKQSHESEAFFVELPLEFFHKYYNNDVCDILQIESDGSRVGVQTKPM